MVEEDGNGYLHGNPEHSTQISRQIAYKKIYRKHRERYPLRFSDYVIHHRDRQKHNNSLGNLDIVTLEEHEAIHKLRLAGKKELDIYETEQYANENDKYVSLEELNKIKKQNLEDWKKKDFAPLKEKVKSNFESEKKKADRIRELLELQGQEIAKIKKIKKSSKKRIYWIITFIILISLILFFNTENKKQEIVHSVAEDTKILNFYKNTQLGINASEFYRSAFNAGLHIPITTNKYVSITMPYFANDYAKFVFSADFEYLDGEWYKPNKNSYLVSKEYYVNSTLQLHNP